MKRRDFIKAGLAGLGIIAFPWSSIAKTEQYPPEIAQFITPDFEYMCKIKRVRLGEPDSDVYEFWHGRINQRLHIGYLSDGGVAAQWWCKGLLWIPSKAYYCCRTSPRYMQRFIQSYIREN